MDPVYNQFEEFNKLNQRNKQIYVDISKQTFDLFDCLLSLKFKNKIITQKNKKSDMLLDYQEKPGKEDILESLTNDLDLADDISELDLNDQSNLWN